MFFNKLFKSKSFVERTFIAILNEYFTSKNVNYAYITRWTCLFPLKINTFVDVNLNTSAYVSAQNACDVNAYIIDIL